MRKSRFTESQIVGILKEGEVGIPLAKLVQNAFIERFNRTYREERFSTPTCSRPRRRPSSSPTRGSSPTTSTGLMTRWAGSPRWTPKTGH